MIDCRDCCIALLHKSRRKRQLIQLSVFISCHSSTKVSLKLIHRQAATRAGGANWPNSV